MCGRWLRRAWELDELREPAGDRPDRVGEAASTVEELRGLLAIATTCRRTGAPDCSNASVIIATSPGRLRLAEPRRHISPSLSSMSGPFPRVRTVIYSGSL